MSDALEEADRQLILDNIRKLRQHFEPEALAEEGALSAANAE
jgi:hypothetical protein